MKCDIIIPIWNNLKFTEECIESIIKNTRCPYRLILIDNASDGETRNYIVRVKDKLPRETVLIKNEANLGFIKAVNQGLKVSDAPYVCIMNNDTHPAPGWLERMIDFAEDHKDVGLINPQCDGHLNTPIDEYAEILKKNKGKYMEMNQCHGFCMLVKREVIDSIGYLDEAFGIGGYDDTDYSMRAHKAGFRSVAIGDAYVYHRLHASFDKAGTREEWVRRNQKIYYDKWGKHLRMGIPFHIEALDDEKIAGLVKFAYGLAREWAWVHLWINSKCDKSKIEKSINDCMRKNDLPPHQNIRIYYFNLPKILFFLTIAGKLLERMRKRMKDKRFDAIIMLGNAAPKILSISARITGTTLRKE